MLRSHGKADIESAEIEGDQVVERRSLDGVQPRHPVAMALEDLRRHLVRLDGADEDSRQIADRIPAPDAELAARGAADVDAEMLWREGPPHEVGGNVCR